MSAADYLAGVVWFALSAGPVAAAGALLVHRRFGHLGSHAMRVLAWSLLTTAGLIAMSLIPGALGILTRGTVVLTAFALLAAVLLLTRREAPQRPALNDQEPRRSGPAGLALAGIAVALVAIYVIAFVIERRGDQITAIDAVTFGIPTLARWLQDGSVWSVGHYAAGWAF